MNRMLEDLGIHIDFDYVDARTGEGYTDYELHQMFNDWLDDVHGTVMIAGFEHQTSRVFKDTDPITYEVSFDEWIDFQVEDGFIVLTEDFEDEE